MLGAREAGNGTHGSSDEGAEIEEGSLETKEVD